MVISVVLYSTVAVGAIVSCTITVLITYSCLKSNASIPLFPAASVYSYTTLYVPTFVVSTASTFPTNLPSTE